MNRPGALGRNAFRGPDFRTLDLRLSKAFQFGRRRIELIAEGFNVTNRVNYGGLTSSIQSRFFGLSQLTSEKPPVVSAFRRTGHLRLKPDATGGVGCSRWQA